MNASLSGYYFY